ncbi:MAG: DnaA/Hda family protein [Alphaproteobacteria bacterium]|nr:DnaA/Hda family protein [Alphaproteobacteria bacterium]
MNQQLVFDLPHRPALRRADFWVAESNKNAVALIDKWPHWDDSIQAIIGPAACGKSHLAAVWCMQSHALQVKAAELDENKLMHLMEQEALVIDALEDLQPQNETVLFHLLNHAKQTGHFLLLCSRLPLGRLIVRLPDLQSRLVSILTVHMQPPCDRLIAGVMVKLFNDRQIKIGDDVVKYLVARMERSFVSLNRLVADIDYATLADKRPVTVPLASRIIEAHHKSIAQEADAPAPVPTK